MKIDVADSDLVIIDENKDYDSIDTNLIKNKNVFKIKSSIYQDIHNINILQLKEFTDSFGRTFSDTELQSIIDHMETEVEENEKYKLMTQLALMITCSRNGASCDNCMALSICTAAFAGSPQFKRICSRNHLSNKQFLEFLFENRVI